MNNPFERLVRDKEEAERELAELVQSTDAESLLTCMISQLLLMSPEQNIGDKFGNHAAMLETLAKVCIPRFGDNTALLISPFLTNHCYGVLEKIVSK
ncbi:MAG: hypothetical protein VX100_02865 [Pseudomonadota bacterium]|nr:hypothetical protein [Pseudomonadota bacterium]